MGQREIGKSRRIDFVGNIDRNEVLTQKLFPASLDCESGQCCQYSEPYGSAAK